MCVWRAGGLTEEGTAFVPGSMLPMLLRPSDSLFDASVIVGCSRRQASSGRPAGDRVSGATHSRCASHWGLAALHPTPSATSTPCTGWQRTRLVYSPAGTDPQLLTPTLTRAYSPVHSPRHTHLQTHHDVLTRTLTHTLTRMYSPMTLTHALTRMRSPARSRRACGHIAPALGGELDGKVAPGREPGF